MFFLFRAWLTSFAFCDSMNLSGVLYILFLSGRFVRFFDSAIPLKSYIWFYTSRDAFGYVFFYYKYFLISIISMFLNLKINSLFKNKR